ncbi:MAG: hypothetical protein ACAH80_07530 [Alphaproteobacteria bacterium]
MEDAEFKRVQKKMERERKERFKKASAEALAYIESHPSTTFRFNTHAMNPAFSHLGVRYSSANPEGEAVCKLLRKTYPLTRGADIAFTEAFHDVVTLARERDYLQADPAQPDTVLTIKVPGPISILRPLAFKK